MENLQQPQVPQAPNVPPTPMPAPQQPQSQPVPMQQPKKSLFSLIIIIIIIICALGGSAYAYYTYTVNSVPPTEVLKNSLNKITDIRSFSFISTTTGQVSDNVGNGIPSKSNIIFTTNGSIDFHSLDALVFNANIGIDAKTNTATDTGALAANIDTMFVGKSFYLNLRNFNLTYRSSDPAAGSSQLFIGMANGIASTLENKWIEFDASGTPALTSAPSKTSSQNSLTPEDIASIHDYLQGLSFVKNISSAGTETINGVSTRHLKLNVLLGQPFLDLVQKIALEKVPTGSMNASDLSSFNKGMNDLSTFANQTIALDLWIGQSDYMVYKVVTGPISFASSQAGGSAIVSQEEIFGNYNQPVTEVAPKDAVPFQQFMQSMFGGMMGGSIGGSATSSVSMPNTSGAPGVPSSFGNVRVIQR